MYARTPWAAFVTQDDERFGLSQRSAAGLTLFAGANPKPATCRITFANKVIMQHGAGRNDETQVAPYRLEIARWTSLQPPIINAHPFLLLHLLATGQVNTDELMGHIARLGQNTVRKTISVKQPCEVLRMLGRPQMAFRLGCNWDLADATY
jgi:hypothetical protein